MSTTARQMLPGAREIERALGRGIELETVTEHGAIKEVGTVAASAARDVAYRSFRGDVDVDGTDRPVSVGELALVFTDSATSERTFAVVADAAHLRIRMDDSNVAVETVTSASGLVSYWGYVQRGAALVVLTLDTLDPQEISMTTFRALVTLGAEKLAASSN